MSFKTIVQEDEQHPVIILKDDASGTFIEVFAFGAILNKFSVQHQEEALNVMDAFTNVEHAMHSLTPLFNGAKLSPYVCRIKNEKYHFGEHSYHLSKYKMGNHAIHGLIFDAVFSVVETAAYDTGACVKLQHVYDRDDEGFPFAYRCEVEYKLEKNKQLTIITTVTNIDDQLLPIADGWHPYFTLGDTINDYQLEFQSNEIIDFDEELIPTGKTFPYEKFGSLEKIENTNFDNCFTLNFAECQPMCVLRNPLKKIQVEIYPSTEYPYLQIFTPVHRKSIAIENLSAAPDALNNGLGLKVLEPHENATFITKYIIRSL